jgi:hypothetical protein
MNLVYCSHCGTQNADDATNCKNCGAPLTGDYGARYRRRYEHDRFRAERGVSFAGIFFGAFILLVGLIWLLSGQVEWLTWDRFWPLVAILFGLMILVRALVRRW